MNHGNLSTIELQFGVDAVQADVRMFRRDHLQQPPISVVVAKHNMHRPAETFADLVEHEGRAKVAAVQQHLGVGGKRRVERLVQMGDLVVAVGYDDDFGHTNPFRLLVRRFAKSPYIRLFACVCYTQVYMFAQQMQTADLAGDVTQTGKRGWRQRNANSPDHRLLLLTYLLKSGIFAIALLLAGCGQVITLSPTPSPPPTATLSIDIVVATLPPTSTPAPYTPEPTPTPTVTPTPVIHVIRAGETLLSVASQYNVSVAALQDANGILDPRLLQLGQELVIPRQEEFDAALATTLTPTPTPLPIAIENIHFSETTIGGLTVLGEVWNNTGAPLEQVRVGVTLLDEAGEEVGSAEGLAALDLIGVDERAPFAVLFGEQPGKFARYQVYALRAVPGYVGSYYRDLEVNDIQVLKEGYAALTVSGRVTNVGPEEAVQVQVVLTAYDALGRVVATRKIEPEHNVVPRGGETVFTTMLAPAGGPVARVVANAQGRRISAVQP